MLVFIKDGIPQTISIDQVPRGFVETLEASPESLRPDLGRLSALGTRAAPHRCRNKMWDPLDGYIEGGATPPRPRRRASYHGTSKALRGQRDRPSAFGM